MKDAHSRARAATKRGDRGDTGDINDISNISDISDVTNMSGLAQHFSRGVDDKELATLQGRICAWFAARGWTCAYAKSGPDGRLESFQSGDSDYCEWGHYLGSGPYDWLGRTGLARTMDRKQGRAHLHFPSGRETQRWSSYTAIIALPTRTELQWDTVRGRFAPAWNGKPPRLWWKRERCDRARYERRRAMYEAKHDYRRLNYHLAFRISGYVPDEEASSLKVPEEFAASARDTLRQFQELLGIESAKPRTRTESAMH